MYFIIVNVSTAAICTLLEKMKPLLMQVIMGEQLNWRHNVVRRVKQENVNGHRVMSHHMNSISCNTGDFTNGSQEYVLNFAESLSVVCDFDYVSTVLYPTLLEWLVIVLCDVNAPKARIYLNEGGSYAGKTAYDNLKRKITAKNVSEKRSYRTLIINAQLV